MSQTIPTAKVRLFTSEGEYVASVELPDLDPHPRVLEWGARVFVSAQPTEYVEAVRYQITGNVTDEGEVPDINIM